MTVPLDDTRPTDWTPERHAAAKVRDAEAPKGPWGVFEQDCLCWITGPTCIIGNEGQMSRSVAAFVAHAREDLPAALVEIERLGDVVSKIVKQHLALANDADRLREEIERLTAELAARAPADCDHRAGGEVSIAGTCADCGVDFADLPDVAPADASLEAAKRTWRGEWQRIAADIRSMSEAGKTPADILAILLTHLDRMKPFAVVRAVDASRPAAPERTFPRVTLGSVAPGSLIENAGGFIALALDREGRKHRRLLWVDTGLIGDMHEGATVSLRATPAELDALTSADANGPTFTNEQLDAIARAMPDVVDYERATPEQRRETVLDVLAVHGPRPNRSALPDIDADNTARRLLAEMGIRAALFRSAAAADLSRRRAASARA